MGMGRRPRERQSELFVATADLPRSAGHVFYEQLNELLASAGFDDYVENLCAPYYDATGNGRPSIPPGVYFRMLLIGYFEGLGSQRGIAWRCSDSLSLRQFLGLPLTESPPDHSNLTRGRDRLPQEVHAAVMQWVLQLAHEKKLFTGETVGVDSTTIEANAAMKSIVRKGTGEDWKQYITGLMRQEGVIGSEEEPSAEEIAKFDRKRKGKKCSNDEWESPSDPDARITKMKDGRTHLAYKQEHVVDLESEFIVGVEVYEGNASDHHTLVDSLMSADVNLQAIGDGTPVIKEAAADKGYHNNEQLELASSLGLRTYIPEPDRPHPAKWTDKPAEQRVAVENNRRRMRARRANAYSDYEASGSNDRSRMCARQAAPAHVAARSRQSSETKPDVGPAHNLGLILRSLFKMGTPRGLQGLRALVYLAWLIVAGWWNALWRSGRAPNC